MFLSKEEFIFFIAIASGAPLVLIGFVTFLLFRQNNQRKSKQIEIRDAMLSTLENERKRIARDMHDQMGPLITGIKLGISIDNDSLTFKQSTNIEKAKKDCDIAITEIRSITHNLYSNNITSIGLVESLKETISSLEDDNVNFDLEFNIDDSGFSYEFQINIYRICLELINNSLKHSNGDLITLSIREIDHVIILKYIDNGNSNKKNYNKGIGLNNLKNRIKLLGGEIIEFSEEFSSGAKYKVLFKY